MSKEIEWKDINKEMPQVFENVLFKIKNKDNIEIHVGGRSLFSFYVFNEKQKAKKIEKEDIIAWSKLKEK